MYIKSLSIKNFRSIKDLYIETEELCAIIGPNSSGKTNILRAIDLVLGEGWTTKAKVAKELFNDTSKSIEINIVFNSPIEFTNAKGYKTSIFSLRLEMTLQPELYAKTTINNGDTFFDQEQFKKLCHFIHIPSERLLESELRVSQWTMLGKLMKLIYEGYLASYENDEKKLKEQFEKEIKPAKDFLEKDFSKGTDTITFIKFSETFRKYCLQNSAGLACDIKPVLNIYNLNWFYKTLQIQVNEDFPDKLFDSDEVGSGMQNLLMLSIFQTYAELMGGKVIFGIEEPEIYLYPLAQRSLYKNFIRLSESVQIFYTTHNPNFVDAMRPDDMLLLRKSFERGTYKLEKDPFFNTQKAQDVQHKIYTHFNPERNEIFFAKKVILVEGDSDKILFSTLFREKWNIDLDLVGVSLISCGGKSGVNYFIGVCKLIGLEDYFAIWDSDNNNYKPDNNLLPNTIRDKKGLEVPGDLESFLGLPTGEDTEKVKNAFNWARDVKTDTIPKEFIKLKEFINVKVDSISKEQVNIENDEDEIPF